MPPPLFFAMFPLIVLSVILIVTAVLSVAIPPPKDATFPQIALPEIVSVLESKAVMPPPASTGD
jgi:hypothetical protein